MNGNGLSPAPRKNKNTNKLNTDAKNHVFMALYVFKPVCLATRTSWTIEIVPVASSAKILRPSDFGEQGIYLMGTGEQRPNFDGNKDNIGGGGGIYDFGGTGNKLSYFRGTREQVPPSHTHTLGGP